MLKGKNIGAVELVFSNVSGLTVRVAVSRKEPKMTRLYAICTSSMIRTTSTS